MLQWGVQSIAALGLSEKHKFYHIIVGLYGQEAQPLPELPPLQPVKNNWYLAQKNDNTILLSLVS
ncbi:hypothetical protein [Chryseobacterium oncorhynchi]|uniref:Uncharacterized protein n=1 Tax=Chryseobacterium oncorhynchi TaxID=741074 RepID=A0A316WPA5_9FLAO|nr:hypothetical protein [Chryseobacterium oncorhynchi]PWN63291.1 hypothetical protein C1638_014580 [Chryseobacterium oncorhynchi]